MRKKIKYIFLLTLIACATPRQNIEYDTVDIISRSGSTEELLSSGDSITYGPNTSGLEDEKLAEESESQIIALTVLPSLYDSFSIGKLITSLKKLHLKPSVLVTSGFTTLVLALYAKKNSVSYLDWKLFELTKSLKGLNIYSKGWNKEIDEFIEREFKGLLIEDFELTFIIPKVIRNKVQLISRGDAVIEIKEAVKIRKNDNFILKPEKYWVNNKLKDFGVDFSFVLKFSNNKRLTDLNDYYWGVYVNYFGHLSLLNEGVLAINPKNNNLSIDKLNSLNMINNNYKRSITDVAKAIHQTVKPVKLEEEENTTSSN